MIRVMLYLLLLTNPFDFTDTYGNFLMSTCSEYGNVTKIFLASKDNEFNTYTITRNLSKMHYKLLM